MKLITGGVLIRVGGGGGGGQIFFQKKLSGVGGGESIRDLRVIALTLR